MKKKFLISVVASMLSLCSAVQAAGIDTVKYNVQSKTLQVAGTVETDPNSVSKAVTLRVFKPGKTAENISELTDEEKKEALAFVKQTDVNPDGGFSFTYSPKNIENGNHKIYITDSDGNVYSEYILFLAADKNAELMGDINAADTKEKMKAAIEKHSYLLSGIETIDEIKALFPDNDITEAVSEIIAGEKFSDADEIVKKAIEAAVLTNINLVGEARDFIDTIDKYKKELGISGNKIYTDLFLSFKEQISPKFIKKNYKNLKSFITDFYDTIIVDKINGSSNYTQIMPVLDADRSYLADFNFSDYEKLTDKQKANVQKKVADSGSYKTVAEIKNIFNEAVKNPPADDPTPSGGSGSSGSNRGGSSGSGNKIGVAKDTQQENINIKPEVIFDDLSSVEWARESILNLYEKGIVSGMGEKKFEPAGLVTREQFAKMIVSAVGLYNKEAECGFKDVKADMWYYSYAASAADAGIVFGISEELFGIGDNITREDMAVMVFRAAEKAGKDLTAGERERFGDDSSISDYAKDAVYTLKSKGVMSGKGENLFEPKAFATRAEAAKLIFSLIEMGGAE